MTLLDYIEEAERKKQKAIDRVERNAHDEFMLQAEMAVRSLMSEGNPFTTDDIWRQVDATTHEPRAMGAVMRRLQQAGEIVPTGQWKLSAREACHRRPLRVWRKAD